MPFISIRVGKPELTDAQAAALIEQTTALMTDVMNKKAERVSVQISVEDPNLWAVGRKRVADIDGCAVRMSIDVTAGTNSITEKEAMVAASTEMLERVLKINSDATYIIINEIPGVSWGKGGIMLADRTKADRQAERSAANAVA
jgi:4-oxalocrotonate tautomerase family enzyme